MLLASVELVVTQQTGNVLRTLANILERNSL